ncbi:hypothetical protein VP01_1876g3 [Puccinia sorghi]|uniref:Uncharacterized protein n=1 Tax=Puccinia sorghi TaxID=27349 RepID=A0A0L6VF12_9BASI|nr:hypothetical protein VP01_1876g3 [Puccinia sorghi]
MPILPTKWNLNSLIPLIVQQGNVWNSLNQPLNFDMPTQIVDHSFPYVDSLIYGSIFPKMDRKIFRRSIEGVVIHAPCETFVIVLFSLFSFSLSLHLSLLHSFLNSTLIITVSTLKPLTQSTQLNTSQSKTIPNSQTQSAHSSLLSGETLTLINSLIILSRLILFSLSVPFSFPASQSLLSSAIISAKPFHDNYYVTALSLHNSILPIIKSLEGVSNLLNVFSSVLSVVVDVDTAFGTQLYEEVGDTNVIFCGNSASAVLTTVEISVTTSPVVEVYLVRVCLYCFCERMMGSGFILNVHLTLGFQHGTHPLLICNPPDVAALVQFLLVLLTNAPQKIIQLKHTLSARGVE